MKKRVSIIPLLIITGFSIFIGMWIFQGLKLVIHPTMTRDESQFITIIFNTLLATVVMYFVMLKREILFSQLTKEVATRKKHEETLQQQKVLLRVLSARLSEVEENERKRLAAELHDLVGQNLTALGINLNIISDLLPADASQAIHSHLQDSTIIMSNTIESIRNVITDLRPAALDDFGLTATIRWYGELFSERTGLTITMNIEELIPRLPVQTENALFRIYQEALTNVQKHAQATEISMFLEEEDGKVRMLIHDNGIGFETADKSSTLERKGWGLEMMGERAIEASGSFIVKSQPGQGTQVKVEVQR
jgi:signal transduction histidine kinase